MLPQLPLRYAHGQLPGLLALAGNTTRLAKRRLLRLVSRSEEELRAFVLAHNPNVAVGTTGKEEWLKLAQGISGMY